MTRRGSMALLLVSMVLAPALALGASRPRYGGTAVIASVRKPSGDPLLADTPADVALSHLVASGLCRLGPSGVVPVLARRMTQTSPTTLDVELWPDLHIANGSPLTALDVVTAWRRLFPDASASPYRALLFPISGGEAGLSGSVRGRASLSLHTAFPWPDLERSLCHPALAITIPTGFGHRSGTGPFAPGKIWLRARARFPVGRPFLDRIRIRTMDARSAERAFELGHVSVVLGSKAGVSGPLLYATYLLYRPEQVGRGFRGLLEQTIDRDALVRYFVPRPAAALATLIPPSVRPEGASEPSTPAPGADAQGEPTAPTERGSAPANRQLILLYDETRPSQRAVAERIALRLQQAGISIRLEGASRAALNGHWAKGDFDLMLRSVLLPPEGAPALAVALDLGGRGDLLARELPSLGAISDAGARDAAARKRAAALGPETDAFPLYVQGARVEVSPKLEGLTIDPGGIPDLVDASLAAEAHPAPSAKSP